MKNKDGGKIKKTECDEMVEKVGRQKNKRLVTTVAPKEYEKIEKLVNEGRYKNQGDLLQVAVRRLIAEEVDRVELDEKTLRSVKKALGIT